MSSSPDDKLIEDGVQDFFQRVHSDLPLRHFGEFHDPGKLKKVVELQKKNVFKKLFDKIWKRDREEIAALFKKVNRRMDNEVVAEWRKKNQEHEIRSVSFLQKWVDMLCENFNEALESQLHLNPDMELKSLKNYISSKKQTVTNVFEMMWKPGTLKMQEERKSKLEKHLKAKEEEMLVKHECNVERKSVEYGNRVLKEVTSIVLEKSRLLKSHVDKHQGHVSKDVLKEMMEEIREYLLKGKGKPLRENHLEIYSKLVETLEDAVLFFEAEPKQNMTAEEVVGYVERIDENLRSYCLSNGGATNNAQKDASVSDPDPTNAESRRGITLQEILNQVNLEEPEAQVEVKDIQSGVHVYEDDNEKNLKGNDKTSSATKTRNIRRSRRLSSSAKDASSNEVPSSKNKGTRNGSSYKVKGRAEENHRGSQKKIARDLVDPPMKSASEDNEPTHASNDEGAQIRIGNANVREENASPDQLLPTKIKRKQGQRNGSDKVDDSPPKRMNFRGDVSIRRSARSKNSMTATARDLPVKSRTRRETLLLKKNKKTKDDEFLRENGGENGDDEELSLSSVDIMHPSRSKMPGKKLKRHRVTEPDPDPACPEKITILREKRLKYQCNVCKRKFSTGKKSSLLKYHGAFCSETNRPFKCSVCGKGFFRRGQMTWHARIHTGVNPFKCTKCPKAFNLKSNLMDHLRAHDRGTSYHCKTCNASFVSSQALHNHLLTHEGKLPFACNYCNQRFPKFYNLKNHVIAHSGYQNIHSFK